MLYDDFTGGNEQCAKEEGTKSIKVSVNHFRSCIFVATNRETYDTRTVTVHVVQKKTKYDRMKYFI